MSQFSLKIMYLNIRRNIWDIDTLKYWGQLGLELIFFFLIYTSHLFNNEHVCYFITKSFYEKCEGGEVGKWRLQYLCVEYTLLFHYVKLVSILYFLSTYRSKLYVMCLLYGSKQPCCSQHLSFHSKQPTRWSTVSSWGFWSFSSLWLLSKRTNISIDANTNTQPLSQNNAAEQFLAAPVAEQAHGKSPLFSFQIQSWDIERYPLMSEESPWSTSNKTNF